VVISEMSGSSQMDGSDTRTVHWVAGLPESSGRILQEDGEVPADGSEAEQPYQVPLSESSNCKTPFSVDDAVTDNVTLVEDASSVWSVTIYQDSDQSSDTTSVESVTESVLAANMPICSSNQSRG
jgi:hypothetical protein